MDDSNKGKMTRSRRFWQVIATLVITAVGIFAGVQLWQRYMLTPWTRDGRVVANSVTIASEVSGRIVDIRVRENQSVNNSRRSRHMFIFAITMLVTMPSPSRAQVRVLISGGFSAAY